MAAGALLRPRSEVPAVLMCAVATWWPERPRTVLRMTDRPQHGPSAADRVISVASHCLMEPERAQDTHEQTQATRFVVLGPPACPADLENLVMATVSVVNVADCTSYPLERN